VYDRNDVVELYLYVVQQLRSHQRQVLYVAVVRPNSTKEASENAIRRAKYPTW